jgi:hypothetical protein
VAKYLESSPKTLVQMVRNSSTTDTARQPPDLCKTLVIVGLQNMVLPAWLLQYMEAISAIEKATALPPKPTKMHP